MLGGGFHSQRCDEQVWRLRCHAHRRRQLAHRTQGSLCYEYHCLTYDYVRNYKKLHIMNARPLCNVSALKNHRVVHEKCLLTFSVSSLLLTGSSAAADEVEAMNPHH